MRKATIWPPDLTLRLCSTVGKRSGSYTLVTWRQPFKIARFLIPWPHSEEPTNGLEVALQNQQNRVHTPLFAFDANLLTNDGM